MMEVKEFQSGEDYDDLAATTGDEDHENDEAPRAVKLEALWRSTMRTRHRARPCGVEGGGARQVVLGVGACLSFVSRHDTGTSATPFRLSN
jgi:hypothetical protein